MTKTQREALEVLELVQSGDITLTEAQKRSLLVRKAYSTWSGIKSRCYNTNSKGYKDYGARGIKMADCWKNNFVEFAVYMIHNGYDIQMTVDRIDVNGNYEPENVRGVWWDVQTVNKRNTHFDNETCYLVGVMSGTPFEDDGKIKAMFRYRVATFEDWKKANSDRMDERATSITLVSRVEPVVDKSNIKRMRVLDKVSTVRRKEVQK